ncbi:MULTISPECIES: tRNA (cytidine(34)-2'-O)-methyltransferase [unclassified Adlercreutzia]|uniref:tRNA (cytidine(34)-2'-O)-methyltransferase n=1 Tax=unclassified Adlercreutzia TaxID=2636013 RepID=UPI0013ED7A1B|nr:MULTISPECIES: tRNA (cytidine(34)-2'-O)-methyltransferase [unclassified Adlercreutzia]
MLNVVLVEPEIPQNAGNVARTCACAGARLHLVEPMGFHATERNLKRAGCNYWNDVDIERWPCAEAFFEAHEHDELHLFTGAATRSYAQAGFGPDAYLVFGRESRGLDPALIERFAERCVRIPLRAGLDSLNVSNAAAIAVFEALRQQGFPGLV